MSECLRVHCLDEGRERERSKHVIQTTRRIELFRRCEKGCEWLYILAPLCLHREVSSSLRTAVVSFYLLVVVSQLTSTHGEHWGPRGAGSELQPLLL